LALSRGHAHHSTGFNAKTLQGGCRHASTRSLRGRCLLQGLGSTHDGVRTVNRNVTDPLQPLYSDRFCQGGGEFDFVRKTSFDTAGDNGIAYGFRAFFVEALQLEEIAQYAQHLPGGTRIAQWSGDSLEALCTAFGIHEGA